MTIDNSTLDTLLNRSIKAFDAPPTEIEDGLDVNAVDLLQIRKACRLLNGAELLYGQAYYTLVIECSFTAIERSLLFRLLQRDHVDSDHLPHSHTKVYRKATSVGLLSEEFASDLEELWNDNRSRTYYRDGKATKERARVVLDLAEQIHVELIHFGRVSHECICTGRG